MHLPDWRLDGKTGLITGSPTAAGTTTFTVTATDSVGATATHDYSLVVNPVLVLSGSTTLPPATLDVPYSEQIPTTGGTVPLVFALTTGSLPPGLTLSPTGLISGTPTSASTATTNGTSSFTVMATDASGTSATQTYSLTVNQSSFAITTTSLPTAVVSHRPITRRS